MLRKMLDSAWFYFGLAGVLLLAAVASQFEVSIPSRDEAPITELEKLRERDDLNVVFLLIDTLRADRLGVYGYERPTSPVLDSISSRGIVFEKVVAQSSWTKTSMASLWTGTHPVKNGVLRYNHVLPDEAVVPAELFREAGYRTVGIWRNGWVEPNFGFAQGFEVYVRPTPGAERARIHRQSVSGPLTGTDEDMVTSATDFIRQFRNERFFLYLHFMDIHQYVYDDISAIFGTSYSDAYDQSIHWTDRLLGMLFTALDDHDLLKKTLIVIGSDHGEAFREHGSEGHARNLYREVSYVPFILIPPFLLEQGVRVKSTISNVDVWPTVLDIVGLPPLPGADGVSLLPLIIESAGETPARSSEGLVRPVYSQLAKGWGRPQTEPTQIVAVTDGSRRFITRIGVDESEELYDHTSDPTEQHNLIEDGDGSPEAAELRELARRYAESGGEPPWGTSAGEVELDELRLNHLRALGYVIKP
jgi:arylsulfatase A-like enzyme